MPIKHVVRPGDTLAEIAWNHGFHDPAIVFDHPANADLRRRRPNLHLLRPGDEIIVPDRRPKRVVVATGRAHRVIVGQPTQELRLILRGPDGVPLSGEPYVLRVGPDEVAGETDGAGCLTTSVHLGARLAQLTVRSRTVQLRLGHLRPARDHDDEPDLPGVQMRLNNIGYECGAADGTLGPRTRTALALFQADENLSISGEPDESTVDRLVERHGS